MPIRFACAGLILTGLAPAAVAQTLSTASLPSFARNPAAFSSSQNIWKDLGEGAEFYSFTNSGAVAWGGAVNHTGYRQKLSNNFFVDFRSSSGHEPTMFQRNNFSGFEFATSQFRLGYDMGRFKPYLGVSAGVANAVGAQGFVIPGSTVSVLPQQLYPTQSFTSVSAGFNYAISNKISVGVGVSVGQGNGMLSPFAQPGLQ